MTPQRASVTAQAVPCKRRPLPLGAAPWGAAAAAPLGAARSAAASGLCTAAATVAGVWRGRLRRPVQAPPGPRAPAAAIRLPDAIRSSSSSVFGAPPPACSSAEPWSAATIAWTCCRRGRRAPLGVLCQAPPFGLWPSTAAPLLGAAVAAWARRRLPQGAAPLPALEASRRRPLAPAPPRPSPAGITAAGPKRRRLQVRARTPFTAAEGRRDGAPVC